MKLKSQLRESSIETLRSIAEFWGLTPGDPAASDCPEALADYLYPRLQAPAQFKQAFERLEVSEREVVYFLALHGGELTVEEFRRRMGLHDGERFERIAGSLNGRGFAWRDRFTDRRRRCQVFGIPEPYVRLIDLPPYWKGFLGHHLQALSLEQLKATAREVLGRNCDGKRKQVLVHRLRERLLDPAYLREVHENQGGVDRELFDLILHRNGSCVWRELLETGAQKKINHHRTERLEKLTASSGRVFVQRVGANHYNHQVSVPRDIRHVIQSGYRRDERTLAELSRSGERPGRRGRPGEDFRPNVVLDNSRNLVRDLVIFCAFIQQHHVKTLNNGGIGRNDLKKIVPLLSHNKTVKYVSFLALFAMARKLLIPVGGRWRVSKGLGDWLGGGGRQCFRQMYEYWLGTNDWNEEFVDGDVLHVDQFPRNLIGITELRKLVLRVFAKTPVDAWIEFAAFAESLLPQVAIEIPGRYERGPGEGGHRHILMIMESLLAEPIYWFGLIALGVSDLAVARELGSRTVEFGSGGDRGGAGPVALLGGEEYMFSFKLSAAARQVFGGKYWEPAGMFGSGAGDGDEDGARDDADQFTIQPNLEIITPPDLKLASFHRLLTFAEVRKVDVMSTLALTRESLRAGMELGQTGKDVLEFLRARSRRELPETVTELVEECAGRHGEITLGVAGGYIFAADPMHVEELRANPRVARYIKDVFEDRVILLSRNVDMKKLNRELQKLGFMPEVASDSLHVTGEGLFHVTLRPEELHPLLALLQFAGELEDEAGGKIFKDQPQALLERLSVDSRDDFNPGPYTEPLLRAFLTNYEKLIGRRRDDETRRLKKQVNRLLSRAPGRREPLRFTGENPASARAGLVKLFKFAIEHEMPVKIHYRRSTGEEIDEVIEPESLQGERVYAFCPDHDEHHIYALRRVAQAAL